MRSLKRWTSEEDSIIKEKYPTLGAKEVSIMINRSQHSTIDRAYRLKVKFNRIKIRTFCKRCGIETFRQDISRKKTYCSQSRLCKDCSSKNRRAIAKILMEGRMKQGHINPNCKLFTENELNILKEKYYDTPWNELCKILNRNKSSIIHKALRLGLKRTNKFAFASSVNTINNVNKNPQNKVKVAESLRKRWAEGKGVLSGIALKSTQGLTKKENHPNWLGGISFEPYDKNWDKKFKETIRQRDNYKCQLCGYDKTLCVHHIDYNKKNSTEQNCITLCNVCHIKTNYHREKWPKLFESFIQSKYLTIKCIQQPRLLQLN